MTRSFRFSIILLVILSLCFPVFAKMEKDEVPVNPMMQPSHLVRQIDGDKVVIDNVTWNFENRDGKFMPCHKEVTIDASQVKDVYYISEKFKPEWIAAHGMLMFVMNNENSIVSEDGETSNSLILSVEAWRHEGVEYSLGKGMGKNFKLIYMMLNMEACVQLRINKYHHKLAAFRLLLNQNQKNGLLKKVISEAVRDRSKEFYNTTTNSCVTNAVEIIDKVLEKKRKMFFYFFKRSFFTYNIQVMLPTLTPKYLMKKKVAVASEIMNPENIQEIIERNYDLKDASKEEQKKIFEEDSDINIKKALELIEDPKLNKELDLYRNLNQ